MNSCICFFLDSSVNISLETQYDLQYISIKITAETRLDFLEILQVKSKSFYNKYCHHKQIAEVFAKRRKEYNENRDQVLKFQKTQ